MSEAVTNTPPRISWKKWTAALALIAVLAYLASICTQIDQASAEQNVQPADALVVFGAAEYSGKPSPVFRARLDHALDLFRQGVAAVIITTGGAAADPHYSEGGVGHDYLMSRGVPDFNLIAETQSSDTAQSAVRVAVIMRANHMSTCVAVSDAYHVFRVRKMLEHEGVHVYIAPRPDSRPHSAKQRAEAILREAFSYIWWRVKLRH